ncbi:MAG: phytanoyl-CoA dioxygenase family protein [Streptosporangiales bacterium]
MLTSNGYVLDESRARFGELDPVPASERGDREALWGRLVRDGYLFLRGALDPDAVRRFRRYYFEQLAPSGVLRTGTDPEAGIAGDGTVDSAMLRHTLFREIVPGRTYERFCTQPSIRDWYGWLLGGDTFLHRRRIIRCNRPGESGIGTATQAHYDLVYIREGTDRVLSSWIPLGDCPMERGGLVYLEASHHRVLREERLGLLPRPAASITANLPALADQYDSRWLTADYAAGDMVVHSAYTVHAALDNVDRGGVMRLSTDIRYQCAHQPIDWRWAGDWHDRDGL